MSDVLYNSYPVKDPTKKPNKLGGIKDAKVTVTFSECKIVFNGEDSVVLYGTGMLESGKILQNLGKYPEKDFKTYEPAKDHLFQLNFPLKNYEEGKAKHEATPFTSAVANFCKNNLNQDSVYTFAIVLNPFPTQKLLENWITRVDDKSANIDCADNLSASVFIYGITELKPESVEFLKAFDYSEATKKTEYSGGFGGGKSQAEKDRLNDRWEFLKSFLYDDKTDHKAFTIKEVSKAFNSLEDGEQDIITLLMK
jgi:hypothetical protein